MASQACLAILLTCCASPAGAARAEHSGEQLALVDEVLGDECSSNGFELGGKNVQCFKLYEHAKPYCSWGRCVECRERKHCKSEMCVSGECACRWDEHCWGSGNRRKCYRDRFRAKEAGHCVECYANMHCGADQICSEDRTCVAGKRPSCILCQDKHKTCFQPVESVPPYFDGCPAEPAGLTPVKDRERGFFHYPISMWGEEMLFTCAEDWKYSQLKNIEADNRYFNRPLCLECCSCADPSRRCMHKVFESPRSAKDCDEVCRGYGGSQKFLFSVPEEGTCVSEWPWSGGQRTRWEQCSDVDAREKAAREKAAREKAARESIPELTKKFIDDYDESNLDMLVAYLLKPAALESWSCAKVERLTDAVRARMSSGSFERFKSQVSQILKKPPTHRKDPTTRPKFERVYKFFRDRLASPQESQCNKGASGAPPPRASGGRNHTRRKVPPANVQPSKPQHQFEAAKALALDFIEKMKLTDWTDRGNQAVPEALHAMMADAKDKTLGERDVACLLYTVMITFKKAFAEKESKFKLMYMRHMMLALHPDKAPSQESTDTLLYQWAFQEVQHFDTKFKAKDLKGRCS